MRIVQKMLYLRVRVGYTLFSCLVVSFFRKLHLSFPVDTSRKSMPILPSAPTDDPCKLQLEGGPNWESGMPPHNNITTCQIQGEMLFICLRCANLVGDMVRVHVDSRVILVSSSCHPRVTDPNPGFVPRVVVVVVLQLVIDGLPRGTRMVL